VSAHKVEKSFAARTLFRGLTFAIESGDRIGLIGPNGAGKTTLLRAIAGKLAFDDGNLSLSRGLRVGHLEQSPIFEPGQSVYDAVISAVDDPHDGAELGRVDQWLSRLELNSGEVTPDMLVGSLSGGWKKRVALARELVRNPDLLLLDEPTNHLDIEGIYWLENFLAQAPFATVTITHDRMFLQNVANRIFDLDPRYADGLLISKGEYLQYLEIRGELLLSQERREVVLKNSLRRETEWLRRGAKARQTKQKARIERADELKSDVGDLSSRNMSRKVGIDFQEAERTPQKLIEAKGIKKSYAGRTLFENLDLLLTPKTRLGLLGANGCGKSTLIRCLLGKESVDEGTVRLAEKIEIAYFEQHRDTIDPKKSVLRNVCPDGDYVNFRGQFIFGRGYLDRFLFRKEQHDMPVEKLSGGEQARLRVAQMMLQPANILVLDEPTNDLDLATMTVLEEVLSEFNGAVILVTHDRFFLDQVSNRLLAFEHEPDGSPKLLEFADYLQWEAWRDEQKVVATRAKTDIKAAALAVVPKKLKLSFNEKRELDSMETNIQEAEAKLIALQHEAGDPVNTVNASKLTDLYSEIATVQARIDHLYARWAELES
jgi:ATP-binding cassette subfamily F protein uup